MTKRPEDQRVHRVNTEALQSRCVKKKILHASVYFDPNEIVCHLVGLKDVRVLSYARRGPAVEITIEQRVDHPACPECKGRAWVKDCPVVS